MPGKSVPQERQLQLFPVEKQEEVNGIEMGVLENGIPYLTETGLAKMCGIARSVLYDIASNWKSEKQRPRGKIISKILHQLNYTHDSLFLKSTLNGSEINAYTEPVCIAIIEYYAFEADKQRPEALAAHRLLARAGFRLFIYQSIGYSPEQSVIKGWRDFQDRISLTHNAAPPGYFAVINEGAVIIIPMIEAGVIISDKAVPDISIGRHWSTYWKDNKLHEKYGERVRYEHNYPDYYPQSASNPQTPYAYPMLALGEFRTWLENTYIYSKFPKYILDQAKQGKLDRGVASKAIEAFRDFRQIGSPE